MPFLVEPIVLVGVVLRWCVLIESEVVSTKRSTVAEILGALAAMEPRGRGAGKPFPPVGGWRAKGQ